MWIHDVCEWCEHVLEFMCGCSWVYFVSVVVVWGYLWMYLGDHITHCPFPLLDLTLTLSLSLSLDLPWSYFFLIIITLITLSLVSRCMSNKHVCMYIYRYLEFLYVNTPHLAIALCVTQLCVLHNYVYVSICIFVCVYGYICVCISIIILYIFNIICDLINFIFQFLRLNP